MLAYDDFKTRKMKLKTTLYIIASLAVMNGCKDKVEKPAPNNEQELITSVILTFTDTSTSNTSTFAFRDKDGVGGEDPTIDSIYLEAGKTYRCSVQFLDESDTSDIEDITEEVLEEGADHHICFLGLNELGISMSFSDADNNNFPVPVNSTWTTSSANTNTLTVLLKHKEGHSHSDCDEGETDVEVQFDVKVE